jgi:hypothetical protein
MIDDKEIRYHCPDEVDLHPGEPVILEKQLTGTIDFVQVGTLPNSARDMDSIRGLVAASHSNSEARLGGR